MNSRTDKSTGVNTAVIGDLQKERKSCSCFLFAFASDFLMPCVHFSNPQRPEEVTDIEYLPSFPPICVYAHGRVKILTT